MRESRPAASALEMLRQFMARSSFVASRADLIGHGFGGPRIKNWCRGGRLVQVAHGVYSYGRDVETRSAAWRVGLAVAGPGAVLAGRSACEAWGIIKPRFRIPRRIEVAVEFGRATTHRGLSPALGQTRIEVASRRFELGDIRCKDGLELTRAALALIDLAVNAPAREVRFAFLEACRLKLFDRRDVDYCYRRMVGRRGAKKLRPLLALWVPELKQKKWTRIRMRWWTGSCRISFERVRCGKCPHGAPFPDLTCDLGLARSVARMRGHA